LDLIQKVFKHFLSANPLKYEDASHWIYGKCDIDTDAKDIKDLVDLEDFCIKKYYSNKNKTYYDVNDKNFVSPKIAHGLSNDNYSFYGIIVERCKDDDLRKLAGLGPCKNKDTIDGVIKSSLINIKILDNYPNVLNYDHPFESYFYSLNSMLYTNSFISNDIVFNPALLKTNYGIVFDRSRIKNAYMFSEIIIVTNDEEYALFDGEGTKIYDENGKEIRRSSGFIATFNIYLGNRLQHYERTYQKLQDLLSKIGGFGKTTFLIASTINIIFFKFITVLDTEDFLLSLNKNLKTTNNDETMCNIMIKDPKENKQIIDNIKNPNLYENNLKNRYLEQQLQRNELSKIKQIDKDNNKNITNIKDGPTLNNSEYNSAIKNSTNPSYQPEGGLLNKPNKKCNFCWCQYIWYMICCGTSNKNITYYENFRQRILSEENIIISHYNLYKLISIMGLDNCDQLILDKKYITIF
jgi:hypothetical protein